MHSMMMLCVVGYQGRLGHGDMKDQYTPRQVKLLSTATIVWFHTFVCFRTITWFHTIVCHQSLADELRAG